MRTPFTIYLDLECLIKKDQSRKNNNLEKSYTEKKAKHEPSGWVMLTKCSFNKKGTWNLNLEQDIELK